MPDPVGRGCQGFPEEGTMALKPKGVRSWLGKKDLGLCHIPSSSTIYSNDNYFQCHKGNDQGLMNQMWGLDQTWGEGRLSQGSDTGVETS